VWSKFLPSSNFNASPCGIHVYYEIANKDINFWHVLWRLDIFTLVCFTFSWVLLHWGSSKNWQGGLPSILLCVTYLLWTL
jgi:hypothetical protein